MLTDARRELLEKRKDLAPDADTQKARRAVRRILSEGQPVSLNVRADVRTARGDERPDAIAVTRRQHAERGQRRAAEDPDEDGLRAVVLVMAGRNDVGARFGLRTGERVPAGGARAGLQVRAGRDGHSRHRERDTVGTRELLRDAQLARGLWAKAVVHAVRRYLANNAAFVKNATYMQ